jgi:hypothetical protein
MASKALHAVRRRIYIFWCWMDMQGDESDPAPPRPDPLRVWRRIAPSFGYHGVYKHLFVIEGHPQTRISIHRCYKQYRGGAMRGVWRGDFQG